MVIAKPTRSVAEISAAARTDLTWLADDAREGRGLGTSGLEDAGQFIADRFKRAGLPPMAQFGSYFQPFDYNIGNKVGKDTRLIVAGTTLDAKDFTSFTSSKQGNVTGDLAFVGYAIQAADHEYDDFAGIDVKDKIVLAMRWEPHDENGKSRWGDDWSTEAALFRKADRAAKAGASALIFVNAPTHHDDAERVMDSHAGFRRPAPLPVFHVSVDAANRMLAAAGAPPLAELQKTIDESGKPASRLLDGVSVDATVQLEKETDGVRNVVAVLPGVGRHADEDIVVGAHYDHVGRGAFGSTRGAGQIHNGADDNGSGTAALLQLAQEFALAGRQDRSIVFVAFTLEELGLIGSRQFVDHLPIPKDKIVAMLNLDMVGRMRNEFLYVGGGGTSASFEAILSAADARSSIELKNMGKGGGGPSDHANFTRVKIPSLFLFTGMHGDYHSPSDDVDKINYNGIAQVVWLSFDLVKQMCVMPRGEYVAKFDIVQPDTDVRAGELPTTQPRSTVTRTRVQLGIVPSYTQDETIKGVVLDDVTPGLPAAKAGLKPGDVIVKLNTTKVDSIYDLTGFLGDAKPGDKVTITATRAGETVTLEATLAARGGAR